MSLKKIGIIIFCVLATALSAGSPDDLQSVTVIVSTNENLFSSKRNLDCSRPSPLFEKFKLRKKKSKRITAALLAFPFPCGIVGLHRIYLGSAPYVPIVYIATLGGALGILPFIDFCVLLIDNDLEPYVANDKVFMWVN